MTKKALLLVLVGFIAGCSGGFVAHDENVAAQKALEFARLAFINNDAQAAYPLLAEETQRAFPMEKFIEALAAMHPGGLPVTITANQFEPMPGQKALSIMLVGENSTEKFYYRCIMIGTVTKGYKIGGFLRGNGPYPGNPKIQGAKLLQPLKTTLTVGGEGYRLNL